MKPNPYHSLRSETSRRNETWLCSKAAKHSDQRSPVYWVWSKERETTVIKLHATSALASLFRPKHPSSCSWAARKISEVLNYKVVEFLCSSLFMAAFFATSREGGFWTRENKLNSSELQPVRVQVLRGTHVQKSHHRHTSKTSRIQSELQLFVQQFCYDEVQHFSLQNQMKASQNFSFLCCIITPCHVTDALSCEATFSRSLIHTDLPQRADVYISTLCVWNIL